MLLRLIGSLLHRGRDAVAANEAGIRDWQAGDRAAAERQFRAALARRPRYAAACSNLGMVLVEQARYEEGHALLTRAVALDPEHVGARINLANTLYIDGRLDQALPHYEAALALAPLLPEVRLNVLRPLMDACAWDQVERITAELLAMHRDSPARVWADAVLPFTSQLLPLPGDLRLRVAGEHARRLEDAWFVRRPGVQALRPARDATRLRVGYLSRDFRNNAVGHLTAGMFALHDRSRFEVSAYSIGPDDGSEWRRRVAGGCEHFIDLRDAEPEAAARRIAADGIDVLVDFGGHTGGSRPEILALRPAAVQVNWLGYPGTLGGGLADYVIADRIALPPEFESDYSEAVARMPNCYQVNDRAQAIATRVPGRAEEGLPAQGVVYCAFNQAFKIDRAVFAAWMRVLAAVPGSVLWLQRGNELAANRLRAAAKQAGIDPLRLVFAASLPKPEHLARHVLADVFLDTWEVNAGTTASDALWAGLPVLTCPGGRFVTRVAASLVSVAGMPEFIAEDRADYERIAIELGRSPARVAAAKAKLAGLRLKCPLFDTGAFVRDIERAYEIMAGAQRAGRAPQSFDLPPLSSTS